MKNYKILLLLLTCFIHPSLFAANCGDLVTADITLSSDLHCDSGFFALEVFADNVTIDLNGHTISGDGVSAGIIAVNRENVTIKNGTINGFEFAINTAETNALTVTNMMLSDSTAGLVLSSANQALITENQFVSITGIALSIINFVEGLNSSNNLVQDNEFYINDTGIQICGRDADNNRIVDNLIVRSEFSGIDIEGGMRNRLIRNSVVDSGNTALRILNGSRNAVINNTFRGGVAGIQVTPANAPTNACLPNTTLTSVRNNIRDNNVIGFETGVTVGSGLTNSRQANRNRINDNHIYDNNTGIFFNTDSFANTASNNSFFGTITPVVYMGSNNTF